MRASLDAPIRTSSNVLERILSAGRPALIVFETPACGPGEALRPALDDVAHEFRDRLDPSRIPCESVVMTPEDAQWLQADARSR